MHSWLGFLVYQIRQWTSCQNSTSVVEDFIQWIIERSEPKAELVNAVKAAIETYHN